MRADAKDLDTVAALHGEARTWLASKGLDQWQPERVARMSIDRVRSNIARSIAKGDCFLALDGGEPVATITLDTFADPEFWLEEDHPGDALYVHRMIVARSHAGQGIGKMLIDWAAEMTARAGRPLLRLDAWRTNADLQTYYARLGFEHVRTVDLPHRGSGALFQRRVHASAAGDWPQDRV